MPQDAFHIRRLTAELSKLLVGGKINRISQVNKDELTLIIYTGKSTVKLIISTNASNARVCLSAVEKEPAPVAPNFCMLLRKHLQGAEIIKIEQYGFERIVEITLHCTGDFSDCNRTLVCEVMGKYSNVVLVENGVVLGALKTTALLDDTHRVLFAGAKYCYPAPQDKLSHLDGAGMRSRLQEYIKTREETLNQEDLARFIFENVAGLALPTARELVARAEEKNGNLALCLSPSAPAPLWDFVGAFCEKEPSVSHVKMQGGVPVDFFAFAVDGGESAPSLCKAADTYYIYKESKKGLEDKKRKLESSARSLKKKACKRLADTLEKLREAEKAEENKQKGELLTANLYRIEKGASSVELENWYSETGGMVKIVLDPLLSPSKNAQKYFKQYNKQKRAKEILTPMAEADEREAAYADSVLSAIALAETDDDLKEIEQELMDAGLLRAPKQRAGSKKKEVVVPFREYAHNGFTVLVGRNNLQNDRLVRSSSPNDIWLHTQKYHSAHVIIVTEGRQVRDETLIFAAELCAYYSDGRDSGKIPVDYCLKKFVKKPSKSKAGFVVYTDYKTVLVQPHNHKENKKSAAE